MASAEDADAFRRLNEAWISERYALEEADRKVLNDPFTIIVDPGGDVLIVRDECRVVGCVALVNVGGGIFELAKMTVVSDLRNRGIGRSLLEAAIERARDLGARSLFLGTSVQLPAAVHLYEGLGFRRVPREQVGPMPYERADLFMALALEHT